MSLRKKLLLGLLVLASAAVATYFLIEYFTTDQQRVERVIRRLAGRIESRDAPGFCHYLTEDYADSNGFNRLTMRAFLGQGLYQLAGVSVRLDAIEIKVDRDEALAEFTAYADAEARDHGDQPPWHHQTQVRVRLRKADGEWRVRHAEYALPAIVRFEGL